MHFSIKVIGLEQLEKNSSIFQIIIIREKCVYWGRGENPGQEHNPKSQMQSSNPKSPILETKQISIMKRVNASNLFSPIC